MPHLGWRLDGSRRLVVTFAALLLVPTAVVLWLGVRLVDQDRALESRRLRERQEVAAAHVASYLEQALLAVERQLDGPLESIRIDPGDDAVTVALNGTGVRAHPGAHLSYYPDTLSGREEPATVFGRGEMLEYRANDLTGAAAEYRRLAGSDDDEVRAGALLGLARVLRRAGKPDDALEAYERLARVPGARVAGLPADLVARRARFALLQERGRHHDAKGEAAALRADLLGARWMIDRATLTEYLDQVGASLGEERVALDPDADALASAVDWLWREGMGGALPATGRRVLHVRDRDVAVLWRARDGEVTALVAGPRFQERTWLNEAARMASPGVQVSFLGSGQGLATPAMSAGEGNLVRRTAADSGLPWTIVVSRDPAAGDVDGFVSRRRMLLAGLVVLIAVLLAGGGFAVRAVSRDLAVARLQSDFVSAVSHEFRTPLTSLRQFTDLLGDEADASPEERRTFVQAQSRATARLQRLVESLLDFGRMEAGRRPYRMQLASLGALVRDVTAAFEREVAPKGMALDVSIQTDRGCQIDADAMGRAVWNLLDNAVKYSGGGRRVRVTLCDRGDEVAIAVQDDGIGIPKSEQREVFRRFVRGEQVGRLGIKGTGLGLAMVAHIVHAHGGSVEVDSEEGGGSTFTILLRSSGSSRTSRASGTSPPGTSGPQPVGGPALKDPKDPKNHEDPSLST